MKIAAYCRVSTDKDEQIDSLVHQKEFFDEYARKNGHELVRLYADEGISGTSLKKRDEFMRLIRDAKIGRFEMVVVKDVSRLARNTVDFLQSIRTLKSFGVNTLFLTANMDSLGESEFVLTLFGAMAQEESANLSKRVKFGKKVNAKKGRVPQRIFGYDRVDNFTLAINHKEAKTVKEIFRLYLEEGLGCRTISLRLNAMGAKTKFGCEWNARAVRRVLANPIYCGHYVNNKYETEDYLTGKQVRIPEGQHFHHDRPEWAIVSADTFEKTQKQLEERRKKFDCGEPFKGARHSTRHLFSTLIKCEHCGRSFCQKHYTYVNTRVYWTCTTNDQYTAIRCDNNVKVNENELLDELRRYFTSLIQDKEKFIREILASLERRPRNDNKNMDASAIAAKRKRLLAKKGRYQEMYANDVMTMTELKEKTSEIIEELNELNCSLKQYEQAMMRQREGADTVKPYVAKLERILAFEAVTNVDLRKIIEKIVVNKDGNVKIILRKLDSAQADEHIPI